MPQLRRLTETLLAESPLGPRVTTARPSRLTATDLTERGSAPPTRMSPPSPVSRAQLLTYSQLQELECAQDCRQEGARLARNACFAPSPAPPRSLPQRALFRRSERSPCGPHDRQGWQLGHARRRSRVPVSGISDSRPCHEGAASEEHGRPGQTKTDHRGETEGQDCYHLSRRRRGLQARRVEPVQEWWQNPRVVAEKGSSSRSFYCSSFSRPICQ